MDMQLRQITADDLQWFACLHGALIGRCEYRAHMVRNKMHLAATRSGIQILDVIKSDN